MSGFTFWYGLGTPGLDGGAFGAAVADVDADGVMHAAVLAGDVEITRKTGVSPRPGDVIRVTFGATYADFHRGDSFVCRLWLPATPERWFAGREARAVWP